MARTEFIFDQYADDDPLGRGDPNADDPDLLAVAFRKRKIETDMDITPMIDITFLLLIFFLVASRIDDNTVVKLPTAKNGTAVTIDDSAILTVVPRGSGVAVYMGESTDEDMRFAADDTETQTAMITDYVQRELVADVPKQQVLIRAAQGIKFQEVSRIISAAGMVEGADVFVAVIEE